MVKCYGLKNEAGDSPPGEELSPGSGLFSPSSWYRIFQFGCMPEVDKLSENDVADKLIKMAYEGEKFTYNLEEEPHRFDNIKSEHGYGLALLIHTQLSPGGSLDKTIKRKLDEMVKNYLK